MQLETVKIDLGNGDYALVYKHVLRVTARLHEAELRKYMTPVLKEGSGVKILLSELDALGDMPKLDYQIDLVGLDSAKDTINEIYILNQTDEWSFGPINQETLNDFTRDQYQALVKEMDRLYKPSPLLKEGSSVNA